MIGKDNELAQLVERLDLERRGWVIVDHWEADTTATGIAAAHDPRRLVYVSVFGKARGYFDYECEAPKGPAADDYETTASGENVTFEELQSALSRHLAPSE